MEMAGMTSSGICLECLEPMFSFPMGPGLSTMGVGRDRGMDLTAGMLGI